MVGLFWFFSEREITTLHQYCVFSLFLLLMTVKEKAHKNVQYYLKCPQDLTVALLGFQQFQFVSIPGSWVFMKLALFWVAV